MKRRVCSFLTAVILLFTLSCPALAARPVQMQRNGESLTCTPILVQNRAFLPAQSLFTALEIAYQYHEGALTARRGDTTLTLTADIKTDAMDVAPYEIDGVLWVPVRYVAEAFGYNVGWDVARRTVLLLDVDTLARAAETDGLHTLTAALAPSAKGEEITDSLSTGLAYLVEAAGLDFAALAAQATRPAGRAPIAAALVALPLNDCDTVRPMADAVLDGFTDQALQTVDGTLVSTTTVSGVAITLSVEPISRNWSLHVATALAPEKYGADGFSDLFLSLTTGTNQVCSVRAALPGTALSARITG